MQQIVRAGLERFMPHGNINTLTPLPKQVH